MQSLRVQCPIPVKAMMTEELRDELLAVEQNVLADLERQLSLLDSFSAAQEDVFERQRRLLMQHAEVEARIIRLSEAPLGEEFLLRVVHSLLELRVGDNFLEQMSTQIVLENGVITSISPRVSALEASLEFDPEPEFEPELESVP